MDGRGFKSSGAKALADVGKPDENFALGILGNLRNDRIQDGSKTPTNHSVANGGRLFSSRPADHSASA